MNIIQFTEARARLRGQPEQDQGLRLATLPDPTTIPPRQNWAATVFWALTEGQHLLCTEERRFLISLPRCGHPSAVQLHRLEMLALRLRAAGCRQ
jgi:hypothetical protein